MGRRFKIPWIGGSKYHGYGGRYAMSRWTKIPWVVGQDTMDRGSLYHGYGAPYTIGRGSNYHG